MLWSRLRGLWRLCRQAAQKGHLRPDRAPLALGPLVLEAEEGEGELLLEGGGEEEEEEAVVEALRGAAEAAAAAALAATQ